MKKVITVLLSVLFCPLSFLGISVFWNYVLKDAYFAPEVILTFALGTVIYFFWAGGALSRWSGLKRIHIWLWMMLLGYPLCWAAAILCLPSLLFNGFIILAILFVTLVLAAVWGVVGLILLLIRFFRTPAGVHLRRGKNALSTLWGIIKPMLLVLAIIGVVLPVYELVTMRPAADYTDQGLYTFVASSAYPTSRKSTTSRGRTHTYTVYLVTYKAKGGAYTYTEELPAESTAKQYVREKRTVERRVLSIPAEKKYITIAPKYPTAESFVNAYRQRYLLMLAASAVYFTAAAVVIIWRKRQREPAIETAGNQGQTRR